ELLTDLIARLEIEPGRLKEVIAEASTRLESSLANLGFQFAILLAQAKLSSEGALNERLQGIDMLHTTRELAALDEGDLDGLIASLQAIRTTLFRRQSLEVVVTCEEGMVDTIRDLLATLVAAPPADRAEGHAPKPDALDS